MLYVNPKAVCSHVFFTPIMQIGVALLVQALSRPLCLAPTYEYHLHAEGISFSYLGHQVE